MHALVTVAGRDRVGIVRDVAEAMLHLQASIEDSAMSALRGWFVVMMLVRLPEGVGFSDLSAALADLERRTGLSVHAEPVREEDIAKAPPQANALVLVDGADRVGIVHGVAEAIAEAEGSIVDLSTQLDETRKPARYRMALEVAVKDRDALQAQLERLQAKLGVQIELQPIEEGPLL